MMIILFILSFCSFISIICTTTVTTTIIWVWISTLNTDWQLSLARDWLRRDSAVASLVLPRLQAAVPNKPTRWQNSDVLALSGIKMERRFISLSI